jgi:hypothetical protein
MSGHRPDVRAGLLTTDPRSLGGDPVPSLAVAGTVGESTGTRAQPSSQHQRTARQRLL